MHLKNLGYIFTDSEAFPYASDKCTCTQYDHWQNILSLLRWAHENKMSHQLIQISLNLTHNYLGEMGFFEFFWVFSVDSVEIRLF